MTQISFIWDLDGTLINSYEVIVSSLISVLAEYNIYLEEAYVKQQVTETSVGSFIHDISQIHNLPTKQIEHSATKLNDTNYLHIKPIKNAIETLDTLAGLNISHYIYTHKGKSTYPILENLHMTHYFKEIITALDNYERKPSPDAVDYLVKKYNLDRNFTYFVGDRKLDIECANNANINSILFLPEDSFIKPTGKEDYIVTDLFEIVDIIKNVSRETLNDK